MARRRKIAGVEHGTVAGYRAGCGCTACLTEWRRYITDYRRGRGLRPRARADVDRQIAASQAALDREDKTITVKTRLSGVAARILTEAQRKTTKSRHQVLDDLLKDYGPAYLDRS